MKKIIPFLILNFIVSALAMFLVLLIWDMTHKGNKVDLNNGDNPVVEGTTTRNPIPDPGMEIQGVIAVGDVEYEKVMLRNIANEPIDLTSWTLGGKTDGKIILPTLTLFPGGSISVYTRAGNNSAIEVYANFNEPLWSSGDLVTLRDYLGETRATYEVP